VSVNHLETDEVPKPNQQTARRAQEAEPVITVDLGQSDPNKAVQRSTRPRSDIARSVNDDEGGEENTDTRTNGWAERSKEVNRRLARQARSLNRTFDQKLADREAEHQRQLSDLRKDMDKLTLERGSGDQAKADADHERAMGELRTKLEAAIEAGNSAQQAQLTADMQRLEAKYWASKAAAAGVVQREQRTEQERQQQQRPAPKAGQPTAAGSRFILANEVWWEDPDYAIEKQAAGLIFAQLRDEEDYDANSDDTFKAIIALDREHVLPVRELRVREHVADRIRVSVPDFHTQSEQAHHAVVRRIAYVHVGQINLGRNGADGRHDADDALRPVASALQESCARAS